ncbi:hypothetical protein ACH47X_10265 [Promicromonospora kroppenstedtii]|uniref:Mce-associated membrane protein n=1 Tax=Promicromonospora kroppenstedtii TaxID=440482 RepID=A0ABW7XID2_9MICO
MFTEFCPKLRESPMVSSAITPKRTIAVLIGVAVIAVAAFAVVRSGVLEPETVQGAIPGPGSSAPSASAPASSSPSAPSAQPSPSPTTPEQIKAQNIADAKARLEKYYETTAQVANNGYKDWDTQLRPFWGHPALRSSLRAAYTESASSGDYTTGAASVESMNVTQYKDSDVGNEEVHLKACVDFGDVQNFSRAGDEIPRAAGAPTRYQFDYVMRHQGPKSYWTVNQQTPHPEQAC